MALENFEIHVSKVLSHPAFAVKASQIETGKGIGSASVKVLLLNSFISILRLL